MNNLYTRPTPTILAAIAATLFFLSTGSVWAQSTVSPAPLMTEREQTMGSEREKRTSGPDLDFRTLGNRRRTVSGTMTPPVVTMAEMRKHTQAEIKRNAERMRFFNGEMMRSVAPGAALDYERISKSAGEIKKRAARLRQKLVLPRIRNEEKLPNGQKEFDARELAAALTKLDGLVNSLSANPLLLLNRYVIDAGQAASAGRDLEDIIVLSDQIRISAKQLKQAARQSR